MKTLKITHDKAWQFVGDYGVWFVETRGTGYTAFNRKAQNLQGFGVTQYDAVCDLSEKVKAKLVEDLKQFDDKYNI